MIWVNKIGEVEIQVKFKLMMVKEITIENVRPESRAIELLKFTTKALQIKLMISCIGCK
jgi:hypothetical protein